MTAEEKRRECFFWLREYMWRGGYGLFAGEGGKTLSPSDILENIQSGKPLPFSGKFLGSCPPTYLFKAVMPYVWHRNAEGCIANKILGPIASLERNEKAILSLL